MRVAPALGREQSVRIAAGDTYGSFTEDRTFSSVYRTTPFPIPVTGTLKVRLVDGDNYDLGNPSTSGLSTDLATPENPLITINTIGDNRVVESSELRFEVIASPAPVGSSKSIRFTNNPSNDLCYADW